MKQYFKPTETKAASPDDFFRAPYRDHVLPLAKVPTPTGPQNYQYRIDPKHCRFCRNKQWPLNLQLDQNYSVHLCYAAANLAEHHCPQRANEKSRIAVVAARISSREGEHYRWYFPGDGHSNWEKLVLKHLISVATSNLAAAELVCDYVGQLNTTADVARPWGELGHLNDHAAFIYADVSLYEMLRHTPVYMQDVADLNLAWDASEPWPFETDPLVPAAYRQWYKQFQNGTPPAADQLPPAAASIHPSEWIQPPPLDPLHPQWERPPVLPHSTLTDWEYDPHIHDPQKQTKKKKKACSLLPSVFALLDEDD